MGKRLTQIATRTGDDGTTGLGDNTRVPKDSLRVQAMGDVDELNSHIGLLLCEDLPADVRSLLVEIQHQLFNLGGELSIPGFELLKPEAVLALDDALEHYNGELPRLQEFILPAGTRGAAPAHVCRTVARRAERSVVALGGFTATENRSCEPYQISSSFSDMSSMPSPTTVHSMSSASPLAAICPPRFSMISVKPKTPGTKRCVAAGVLRSKPRCSGTSSCKRQRWPPSWMSGISGESASMASIFFS